MIVRAVLGGFVVSSFALLGDVLKPKSFAGLFGAAPSVALATLALAVHKHGAGYAALKRIPCFWVRLRSSFMRRRRAV
jgi:hypothetical protein